MTATLCLAVALMLPCQAAPDADTTPATLSQLMAAVRAGDWPQAGKLLDASPPLRDARDEQGRTPLHAAALANQTTVITELLARGADTNARDANGETPLHLAARRLRIEAATLLIRHGADLDARNLAGQTPVTLAATLGPDDPEWRSRAADFVALLQRLGAAPPEPPPPGPSDAELRDQYHTYPQIEAAMLAAATNYPSICRRVSLGQTGQGRSMWAVCISDNVNIEEDEPEFAYISTMHGNEVIGAEMCLYLIDHLTSRYGTDSRVTSLVDAVEIWIIPCMNPDGFVAGTRGNARGIDLNRNFPDPYTSPANTTDGREIETALIMNWSFGRSIMLSANLHSGALVVNYPFDANATGQSVYTPSPDDDFFIWVSEQYSQYNAPMWNSPTFYHGITNGADWYVVYGGMQDWRYVYMGGNEVTIELANSTPPASQLPTYWTNNQNSMLAYMEASLVGVRGIARDAVSLQPLAATAAVIGRDHNSFSDPDVGDYHRLLRPGTYDLRFTAAGFDPLRATGVVVPAGPATRLDVDLWPAPVVQSPNGGETLAVGVPTAVTWSGNPAAAFHVQATYNDGDVQTTTEGFEGGSLGPAFSTGGNLPWLVTTAFAHAGSRAARAGAITHNQTSWLTRTVAGPADVSFWYMVSSEANYDFLTFYVDGVQRLRTSGVVGWTPFTTTLGAGSHLLRWEYAKDGSLSSGSDTAVIDDLLITQDNTTWSDVVALTAPGATAAMWSPTGPSSAARVRVRSEYPDGELGDWDASDAVFAIVPGSPLGDLNCDGRVDAGDITPFATALADAAAYAAEYPDCDRANADANQDGEIDGRDVNALVALLLQ
jgi:hypothetical protein